MCTFLMFQADAMKRFVICILLVAVYVFPSNGSRIDKYRRCMNKCGVSELACQTCCKSAAFLDGITGATVKSSCEDDICHCRVPSSGNGPTSPSWRIDANEHRGKRSCKTSGEICFKYREEECCIQCLIPGGDEVGYCR